jgi:hypothetical protein
MADAKIATIPMKASETRISLELEFHVINEKTAKIPSTILNIY